ncbi:hypothetical protein [Caproiciproducens sp. LBM24188]|nr:hypothetical protein [Oscillospiraceae bacterium]HHV32088.1 hypothetical protein [Clostridiales bacterium]
MFDTIAEIVFILLAITGTVDLVRWLAHWLLKTDYDGKIVLVVPIHGHEESAEMMLTGAIEKLDWLTGKNNRVICVNYNMDQETELVCRIIAARNPCVEICDPDELAGLLEY